MYTSFNEDPWGLYYLRVHYPVYTSINDDQSGYITWGYTVQGTLVSMRTRVGILPEVHCPGYTSFNEDQGGYIT